MTTHALARPGPKNCWTLTPHSRAGRDRGRLGRDDSLAIDARYAARGGWRAGILDFIDRYQVDVIHVNHAFEMLLAVRIRELVFRRTGKTPRLICDTHDVQAKTYAKRGAENPFNKRQDRYSEPLESELSLYRQANVLIHCSNGDK